MRQSAPPRLPMPAMILAALAVIFILYAIIRCSAPAPAPEDPQTPQVEDPAVTRISFVAVGDNLPNDTIGAYADAQAGSVGDGAYDYSPIFEPVAERIRQADLAYIDQETHIGGKEIGPSGYPSFNTTDEMADAVVDAGFDFVASATNHSYDWGNFGAIEHSLSVWKKQPVAFTGTATSSEQASEIALQTREGVTFALLDYTYGVNGYKRSDLPEYAVNFISKERIASDVAAAREVADVVMVAMHWGTEKLMEADNNQKSYAQFLADLNVDVVLGSHPHVIGPLVWVGNSDRSGHRTLVAFSLGNFLADHETATPQTALEGMLTCDFVCNEEGAYDHIENVRWVPLVCHVNQDRTEFAVYAVDDYPDELAHENRSLKDEPDPKGWLYDTTTQVVGPEWL